MLPVPASAVQASRFELPENVQHLETKMNWGDCEFEQMMQARVASLMKQRLAGPFLSPKASLVW